MPRKSKKTHQRFTPAEKAKILAVAAKEDLTGDQVTKKFGIARLTFYRWRGPKPGRKPGSGRPGGTVGQGALRKAVREQVQKLLPQIIREEIEAALT